MGDFPILADEVLGDEKRFSGRQILMGDSKCEGNIVILKRFKNIAAAQAEDHHEAPLHRL